MAGIKVVKLKRSSTQFRLQPLGGAYRLRWQVELLFKEWKSYANLHAFDTSNASLAEGLIWASICAAILKRFLAHTTERIFRVAISTRNVAMSVRGLIFELFDAMTGSTRRLKIALTGALAFWPVMRSDHTLSEISYAAGLIWGWGWNMLRLKN